MQIILAQPRGFCAGVDRAIEIVERALEKFGAPVYVRHEIVHNKFVVESLKSKGAVFVNEISEIPDGAITVFSAHGVSEKVEDAAKARGLPVIDATCPLVTKVHVEAMRYESEGRQVIMIGHEGHPEVEGTSGRVKGGVLLVSSVEEARKVQPGSSLLAYVTQTTLSVDDTKEIIAELKRRFPDIAGPDTRDICYATQNRQNAVKNLAAEVDLILVIGSENSSNSNRLRDLGEETGTFSRLINDERDINPEWLKGVKRVGLTAGASAPESLVLRVIEHLCGMGASEVAALPGVIEKTKFKLPEEIC